MLRDYDAVLSAIRGDAIETSIGILKPESKIVSIVGPLMLIIETESIRPVIDKVFPFAQAKEALEYLPQGHAKGETVIQIL